MYKFHKFSELPPTHTPLLKFATVKLLKIILFVGAFQLVWITKMFQEKISCEERFSIVSAFFWCLLFMISCIYAKACTQTLRWRTILMISIFWFPFTDSWFNKSLSCDQCGKQFSHDEATWKIPTYLLERKKTVLQNIHNTNSWWHSAHVVYLWCIGKFAKKRPF